MTISMRERIAVALIGAALFGWGLAWRSVDASARVDETVRLAGTAQGAAESVTDVVRIESLQGPIFDPFRAIVKEQQDPARSGAVTALAASAMPANPMGFATDRVPRMLDPDASVYALGTGSAMLAPGGPLLHVDDMVGSLRIVAIDGTGVYLSNGSVLRERVVTHTGVAPAPPIARPNDPQATPSPLILQIPRDSDQSGAGDSAAPAAQPSADPTRADLIMRRLLNQQNSTTAPGAH